MEGARIMLAMVAAVIVIVLLLVALGVIRFGGAPPRPSSIPSPSAVQVGTRI